MAVWTFWDYVEPRSNRVPYDDWYSALDEAVQAFIDDRVLKMAGLEKWPEKWATKLSGYEELIELRVTFQKVQYRPLGMYLPERRFVLLDGTIEKNNKLPKGVLDAADFNSKFLRREPWHVRRHR